MKKNGNNCLGNLDTNLQFSGKKQELWISFNVLAVVLCTTRCLTSDGLASDVKQHGSKLKSMTVRLTLNNIR